MSSSDMLKFQPSYLANNKGFISSFCVVFTVILFASCRANKVSANQEKKPWKVIQVNLAEQNSALSGTMVSFEHIIQDSRCPIDVTCIWEGDAEVQLALILGLEIYRFTLHTNPTLRNDTIVGEYNISLLSLEPIPVSTKKLEKDDYSIEVRVEKVLH